MYGGEMNTSNHKSLMFIEIKVNEKEKTINKI